VRRCAARGGAKADAPARRSMSRGETIGAAIVRLASEVRAASQNFCEVGVITTDPNRQREEVIR
jgi:hypothetical protein